MNQFGIGQGNPEEHFRDLKDEAASLVELEETGAASGHAGARYLDGSGCFSCVEISKNCKVPPNIKISIIVIMLTRLRGFLHGDCKDPVNGETACICDTVPVIIRTYIVFVFV